MSWIETSRCAPASPALYRALRGGAGLRRRARHGAAASPALRAGCSRVLLELGLVELDSATRRVTRAAAPQHTDLERSPAFRAAAARHAEGPAWLTSASATPQAA